MKLARLSWDFLFGVLLIGGAPWCAVALTVVLGDLYQSLFHVITPEVIDDVIFGAMFIAAIAAFVYAIRFRLRRRLLPKGVVIVEVLLGIIWAFLLFMFFGVITYSSIG